MEIIENEGWESKKKILVILAHPDDPEFFCGAAIARWCLLGHEVQYCLITQGQRGTQDPEAKPEDVAKVRLAEQADAAAFLGVKSVCYLDHMDGDLIPDLALRKELVKRIRQIKPHILVTSDPTNLFPAAGRINHPDHRAVGQAVIDALFPAVGNPGYRIDDQTGEENFPHQVEEIWLTLTHQANFALNVTNYLETKIKAILMHRSQIHDSEAELRTRYQSRLEVDAKSGKVIFPEKFLRIIF